MRSVVNYQFTRSISARLVAEYDSTLANPAETSLLRTKEFASQALLTWLPHPGTAIYIGYSDDLQNLDRSLCNRLPSGSCDPEQYHPPRAGATAERRPAALHQGFVPVPLLKLRSIRSASWLQNRSDRFAPRGDLRAGLVGSHAAVGIDMRLAEAELARKARNTQHLPEMRDELLIAKPAKLPLLYAAFDHIPDACGGDGSACRGGGVDQAGMKAQKLRPVGARALGKQQHRNRNRQTEPLGDLLGYRHGAGLARPVEKNRPAAARRLAEEGPAV